MPVNLEFDSGTGYELIVRAVAATDRELVHAFDVGPAWRKAAGQAGLLDRLATFGSDGWTGLLGLVLDLPGGKDTATVLEQITAMPPDEVMRYGLGYHRRDFRRLTPVEVFEAAVAGDPAARRELRRTSWPQLDRWQTALRQILRFSAEQYRDALVATMTDWAAVATPATEEEALDARLADDRRATEALRYDRSPDKIIEHATQGVVFVPTSARRAWCSYRRWCPTDRDRARPPHDHAVRLSSPGRAPHTGRAARSTRDARPRHRRPDAATDPARCATATPTPSTRRLDVRRTTVLHHIAQLRSAGLVQVTLEGSAGRYRLREDALHDLADLLAKYLLA